LFGLIQINTKIVQNESESRHTRASRTAAVTHPVSQSVSQSGTQSAATWLSLCY